MAKAPKDQNAAIAALPAVTTRALVTMNNKRFENAAFEPDPDFITADIDIQFNGSGAGHIGQTITYDVTLTKTQVQNEVRDFVNALLDQFEPGNSLTNARIILDGLSD